MYLNHTRLSLSLENIIKFLICLMSASPSQNRTIPTLVRNASFVSWPSSVSLSNLIKYHYCASALRIFIVFIYYVIVLYIVVAHPCCISELYVYIVYLIYIRLCLHMGLSYWILNQACQISFDEVRQQQPGQPRRSPEPKRNIKPRWTLNHWEP